MSTHPTIISFNAVGGDLINSDGLSVVLRVGELSLSDWKTVTLVCKRWRKVANRPDVLRSLYISQGGFLSHIEDNPQHYKERIREIRSWSCSLNEGAWVTGISFIGDRHFPLISLDNVGFVAQLACGAPGGVIGIWPLGGKEPLRKLQLTDAIPLRLFATKIETNAYLIAVSESTKQGIDGKVTIWKLSTDEIVSEQDLRVGGTIRDAGLWRQQIIVIRADDDAKETAVTALNLPKLDVGGSRQLKRRFDRLHIGEGLSILSERFSPTGSVWEFSPGNLGLKFEARKNASGAGLCSFAGHDYLVTEQPNLEDPVRIAQIGAKTDPLVAGASYPGRPEIGLMDAVGRTYLGERILFVPTSSGMIRVWNLTTRMSSMPLAGLDLDIFGPPTPKNWHIVPLPDGIATLDESGVPHILKAEPSPEPPPASSSSPAWPLAVPCLLVSYLLWKNWHQLPKLKNAVPGLTT